MTTGTKTRRRKTRITDDDLVLAASVMEFYLREHPPQVGESPEYTLFVGRVEAVRKRMLDAACGR